MFENNIIQRKLIKRKNMMDKLKDAEDNNKDWEANQLISKIHSFNNIYYPRVFWDSSTKGTYRKKANK